MIAVEAVEEKLEAVEVVPEKIIQKVPDLIIEEVDDR